MDRDDNFLVEVERYELAAAPIYKFDLDRREFFRVLGCGLVVLSVLSVEAQESGGGGRNRGGGQRPAEISAWLHVGEDGKITVFTGKVEVGQNIRTALAQIVAEELHAPLNGIHLTMADTELTPYDAGTFGSRSTPDMGSQMRRISAAAREALIDLAADRLKVDRKTLTAKEGRIMGVDAGQSMAFGELTKGQKLVKTSTDQPGSTPASKWQVAGTSALKAEGKSYVTGAHRYSSDIRRPGMVFGKVLRAPSYNATLDSCDTTAAEALGAQAVRDGNFVGVTAENTLLAEKALKVIKTKWTEKPQPGSKQLSEHFKKTAKEGGRGNQTSGSIEEGLAKADHQLKQSYPIAYIAHCPLEPRAAVAEWKDGTLTVWTGTQRPFGVRGDLAQAFGIPETKVRVIVPDTGSGYGGKHTGECAIEAARLAKAAGKPVKLVWTREEEFGFAYFRPGGLIEVTSGVQKDGTITAWEFHNYNSGGSAIGSPYNSANVKIQFHSTDSPLRQGSYRGLAATANHFAREAHIDELARLIEIDPFEFRMKNLKEPRMKAVLEAAAHAFGWKDRKKAGGVGHGISVGTEKGSYVATCAEIRKDVDDGIRISRVTSAFECGAVVNPEHLKNQIEGSIVMGLGGALFEAIEFENGKLLNGRFSDYRVPRFRDLPHIEVVLVNRTDLPSAGAGETPIVGIAPAVHSAIFDATGKRLRSMPMRPKEALA